MGIERSVRRVVMLSDASATDSDGALIGMASVFRVARPAGGYTSTDALPRGAEDERPHGSDRW